MKNIDLEIMVGFAEELANLASKVTLKYFRIPQSVETKSNTISNMASIADTEAEDAMVELIKEKFPEFGVIREEGDDIISKNGYNWVLDPIDGSSSFLAGRAIWGTLIALVDPNNEVILGVMDQPYTKERWVGAKNAPTLLNGQEISTNKSSDLNQTILAKTTPHMFITNKQKDVLKKIENLCGGKSIWGGDCYSYASLASGYSSPMTVLESDMNFYDFAALIPIIQGAGGRITNWQGNSLKLEDKEVLATSNEVLHKLAIEHINNH
ncbi:MAG: Extragenic suppressor [uncultured Campylobacterales bacterium]|uniref:Extragenic suppressor n=1 Tax=uncultured Campylobacterales bacterium TaxID=352960 RepID=A0A6S6T0X8_9BACT|nr:MAG: Extragenic suppressor [uncultured Campylobacterales bacterium]